jgi:hypothetical protein
VGGFDDLVDEAALGGAAISAVGQAKLMSVRMCLEAMTQ